MNWKSHLEKPAVDADVLLCRGDYYWIVKGHSVSGCVFDKWCEITPPSEPDPSSALAEALEKAVDAIKRYRCDDPQSGYLWDAQVAGVAALAIHRKAGE